ncbi:MAG: integration host factor subunit beta [Calditrichaeota bacterium]|nr:integration host factor subunit beta [Calditrichota bacterium]
MTKGELVNIIADGTGLTKIETQAVIDGFLATVSFALKNRERIDLRNFGSMKTVKRNARIARNPRTGEPVEVPEHYTVVFRPAKDLREYVNQNINKERKSDEIGGDAVA